MGCCSINLIASICERHGPGCTGAAGGASPGTPHPPALANPRHPGGGICWGSEGLSPGRAEGVSCPGTGTRSAEPKPALLGYCWVQGPWCWGSAWESQGECASPGAGGASVASPRAVWSPCVSASVHRPFATGKQQCGHAAAAPWVPPWLVPVSGGWAGQALQQRGVGDKAIQGRKDQRWICSGAIRAHLGAHLAAFPLNSLP